MTRYDLLYLAASPLLASAVAYKSWKTGKYRESLPGMLGRNLAQEPDAPWANGCVWVHAVSVGEVAAARAMLPLLREAYAPLPILLTTMTETGQAAARRLPAGLADAVRYWPADLSWIVGAFLDKYRPRLLVLTETELWPNVLRVASARGIPIVTVNGKISPRSFPRYQKYHAIMGPALRCVSAWCVQTAQDAQRVKALTGLPDDRVVVTGNCKFDITLPTPTAEQAAALRAELHAAPDSRLLVVGSTHPGEEEVVMAGLAPLLARYSDLQIILVPRHPERFESVWTWLQTREWPARRASDGAMHLAEGSQPPRVILVDRMGVLVQLYALAHVALVAGSFVPGIGGHNVLEPASLGTPTMYGPHMEGQPDMVRILEDHGGGVRVPADRLRDVLAGLLDNEEARRELGQRGADAVAENRGAARRNLDVIRHIAPPADVVPTLVITQR